MLVKNKIFLILTFVIINCNASNIEAIIGKSNTLEDVEDVVLSEYATIEGSTCDCSSQIIQTANNIKEQVKSYTDSNIEAIKNLREQVAKNKHELSNRTNKIEKEEYYNKLNNGIQYINRDIQGTNISNIKLLGYNNLLLLSSNGLIHKKNQIINIYSNINELELLEISLKANSSNKGVKK